MVELSKVKGTIGKVINDNLAAINSATSKVQLVSTLESLLAESTNGDKDRFLSMVKGSRNLTGALTVCYNYMLAGDGLRAM